jgi:hypothetical protein
MEYYRTDRDQWYPTTVPDMTYVHYAGSAVTLMSRIIVCFLNSSESFYW